MTGVLSNRTSPTIPIDVVCGMGENAIPKPSHDKRAKKKKEEKR